MDPLTYLRHHGRDHVAAICKRAGTKISWYEQIAHGHANCGLKLAKRLVHHSGGELDLWGLVEAADRKKQRAASA